jgi:hypothetical protein
MQNKEHKFERIEHTIVTIIKNSQRQQSQKFSKMKEIIKKRFIFFL